MAKDVPFLSESIFQIIYNRFLFFQQTLLDYLICVCTGQGQASLETTLNLREIVPGSSTELTNDFIDFLLRCDDDPSLTVA